MATERPTWARVDDATTLVAFIRLCNLRLERLFALVSQLSAASGGGGGGGGGLTQAQILARTLGS